MTDNLTIFLLLVVSIGAAVALTLASSWMRRQAPRGDGAKVALLESENAELKGQIGLLEERLGVLERIACDPAPRAAAQIEAVR